MGLLEERAELGRHPKAARIVGDQIRRLRAMRVDGAPLGGEMSRDVEPITPYILVR